MSCNFDSVDEFAVLDRLQLPVPRRLPPMWRLHAVQLRPGAGDRVYNFVGTSTGGSRSTHGCFAFYPDDVMRVAADTAEWCHGAWPLLRPTPGPLRWMPLESALCEWVMRFGLFELTDIRMLPWSDVGWSMRYAEGRHVIRHFAWFGADDRVPPAWLTLQDACHELAIQALRAAPSARRP